MRKTEKKTIENPVREIPLSYNRTLRGKSNSLKNQRLHNFESSLEGDFLKILEFDKHVARYCEQPVTIEYRHEGVLRQYTPDIIVYYRDDFTPANKFTPLLCEIKYRQDLKQNWSILRPKFAAALNYAHQKGWRFKIMTEVEIRTQYLKNVYFLGEYVNQHEHIDMKGFYLLEKLINTIKHTTPEELLLMATSDKRRRAELLYILWYMVANYFILCDLSKPLNLEAEIWVN